MRQTIKDISAFIAVLLFIASITMALSAISTLQVQG